ncbi:MAG: hypothetical protein C4536_12410 [Actinobacteria bacterium]|jgi:hypothetical protein|nr:MAG: hypothetical protein C4536_12410 [Actinomycetota bacterium]
MLNVKKQDLLDHAIENLVGLIDGRYARNDDLDLFSDAGREAFCTLGPDWLCTAYGQRYRLQAALADGKVFRALTGYMVRRTCSSIFSKNQFVNISNRETQYLNDIYSELLRATCDLMGNRSIPEDFELSANGIIRRHHSLLALFLTTISDASLLRTSSWIPNMEYSPHRQLSVLGLEPDELAEPVLDLGCGMHEHLVRHLRNKGIEAYGIDRTAGRAPYLLEADWMDVSLGDGGWGTIIAHMSFSNHFIHQHLRREGSYIDYARKYMEILGALRVGGTFVYAPGLPFIERHLFDAAYVCERRPVEGLHALPESEPGVPVEIMDIIGPNLYSSRITRKA